MHPFTLERPRDLAAASAKPRVMRSFDLSAALANTLPVWVTSAVREAQSGIREIGIAEWLTARQRRMDERGLTA